MPPTTLTYQFHGDSSRRPAPAHRDAPTQAEPYIASEELKQAVNLAIYLGRPLLLEGEAGCGKTKLAKAVAYELGLPFYRWDIRSTTKAQEGLYTYDAILRLHDVETAKVAQPVGRDPANAETYVELGELGKAFVLQDCPAVVLIDEIDKADIDFPNDLLAVLEEPCSFRIRETKENVTALHKPIVIITSNKEKGNLPAPFLRRCIYHFVQFPTETELQDIVQAHYQSVSPAPSLELVEVAITKFMTIRREMGLFKKPGTSEFLDWLKVLTGFASSAYDPEQLKAQAAIPYRELLLKLQGDWNRTLQATP